MIWISRFSVARFTGSINLRAFDPSSKLPGYFRSSAARTLLLCFALVLTLICASRTTRAQVGDYEGRPVSSVEVVLKGSPADASAQSELRSLLRILPNTEYSAVAARQSLQDLFASWRVATAQIEITEAEAGTGRTRPIHVPFFIDLQIVISRGTSPLTPTTRTPVAPNA